jgi:hypothetical protein
MTGSLANARPLRWMIYERGSPRTRSAMMLRWISDDPAEIVRPKASK